MAFMRIVFLALGVSLGLTFGASAKTITVGIIAPFSGPFASWGTQFKQAVELYVKQHGDTVSGHKIKLVYRDSTGPKPDVAKRLAEELIIKDEAKVLAGFVFTPNALAVAPVITESKTPTVIFNAGTHFITRKSPMFVRTSTTLDQSIVPLTDWASSNGVKTAVTVVSDYTPGHYAAKTYAEEFAKHGGKILESIRIPLSTKDYSVYMQKIKDLKPDGVFIFIAVGPPSIAFMKAFDRRGLKAAGIKLLGLGEFQQIDLPKIGESALGNISAYHYAASHDSDKNRAFKAGLKKLFGKDTVPDLASVGAYDGMHVVYEMVKRTNGEMGPKAVDAVKGLAWESPRGPISIDPKERDIIQNIYIRRVVKENGVLINKEFKTFPNVKDPWKERHPAK